MPTDATPDPRASAPASAGQVNEVLAGRGPRTGKLDDTLIGQLLDRSHTVAPYDVVAMVSEELAAVGARDVAIWLHDYDQQVLHPLHLPGQPEVAEESVDGSLPGRAFGLHTVVEQRQADGATRLWLPLLDGTDRVGVMALTLAGVDDAARAYARRLAGNVAHLIFSKAMYTDEYNRVRRRRKMSLASEIQWTLLPPLAVTTPQVSVAGLLEPAYEIAGDSFDYALNSEGLHFAIFDAMGHGLASAIMANTAVSAYRHARRSGASLDETYELIDAVMSDQFDQDTFATAQLATLDVRSGVLCWVNAGHPPPLLIRSNKAVRFLASQPSFPIGFGGGPALVASEQLEPDDRLLFFTDGVVEHRNDSGEMFGEDRLAEWLVRHLSDQLPDAEVLRRLNRDLLDMIGEPGPSDDATLVLVHWLGGDAATTVPDR